MTIHSRKHAARVVFSVLTGGKRRAGSETARVVLSTANALACAIETFDRLEKGENFFDALGRAWQRGERRAEALRYVDEGSFSNPNPRDGDESA